MPHQSINLGQWDATVSAPSQYDAIPLLSDACAVISASQYLRKTQTDTTTPLIATGQARQQLTAALAALLQDTATIISKHGITVYELQTASTTTVIEPEEEA